MKTNRCPYCGSKKHDRFYTIGSAIPTKVYCRTCARISVVN